ncbi:glycosyltransferase family 4 protein [Nocardioides sp. B-3]|nr:glycosyltransferase family 4 protein [Nocardioides sp. B-3]
MLTGFPNYPSGQIADGYRLSGRQDEVLDGVDVRRVALYPSHDAAMSGRLLNYGTFGASALVSGASALRDVDVLWVNYSPITVAPAMWWLHYARRVPVVVHVLDLWPDTVFASGFADGGTVSRAVTRAAETRCRGMYASAASVVVNSPGVESVLSRRGVDPARINYVPMWANEDVARPADDAMRASLGVSADSIALLYAGALGGAQGLEVLPEACARVEDPRFVCLIAGSGVSEGSLRARANELGLTNVRFLGRVPQGNVADLMGAADAAFISLNDDPLAAITMPSKFRATLAAGRAIVASATGDPAEAVRESGSGIRVRVRRRRRASRASQVTSPTGACRAGGSRPGGARRLHVPVLRIGRHRPHGGDPDPSCCRSRSRGRAANQHSCRRQRGGEAPAGR